LSFVTTTVKKVRCIAETFISLTTENGTPGRHARVSTSAESERASAAATPTAASGSSSSRVEELRDRALAAHIEPVAAEDLGTASIRARQVHLLQQDIGAKQRQVADLQLQLRDCHAKVRELQISTVPIYSRPDIRGRNHQGELVK
jgi:hypothetical protein